MTQNHYICFHCQSTQSRYVSETDINFVLHFIYCAFSLLLSAIFYFSNMSKKRNELENKGECLTLKLLYMLSLYPKGIFDVRKKEMERLTNKNQKNEKLF